jgi:hypothetical protein
MYYDVDLFAAIVIMALVWWAFKSCGNVIDSIRTARQNRLFERRRPQIEVELAEMNRQSALTAKARKPEITRRTEEMARELAKQLGVDYKDRD